MAQGKFEPLAKVDLATNAKHHLVCEQDGWRPWGRGVKGREETHHERQTQETPPTVHLTLLVQRRSTQTSPQLKPSNSNRQQPGRGRGCKRPPPPSHDITSLRSSLAANSCRPPCALCTFFPTAAPLFPAVPCCFQDQQEVQEAHVENSHPPGCWGFKMPPICR